MQARSCGGAVSLHCLPAARMKMPRKPGIQKTRLAAASTRRVKHPSLNGGVEGQVRGHYNREAISPRIKRSTMSTRKRKSLFEIYCQRQPAVSFELFPPKSEKGMQNLFTHLQELYTCGPSFITCTYGAGGSTQRTTRDVLKRVREDYPDLPIASHLTCVNATADQLRDYIRQLIANDVDYLVPLRGDPPKGEGRFTPTAGGFNYASELVTLLSAEFPELGVLVAGYPEVHPEAPGSNVDLINLKKKVECGADAVITQFFFDNDAFFRFRDRCARLGIEAPIIPGILPVTNLSQVKRISALCGATITPKLLQRLEAHGDDLEGQYSVGVYYATRQVEDLVGAGVPGIHFYVLNKSRAASLICRALNLSRTPRGN
jgi:methylenetetrahydrofolate reductase (NADPH)